jgi:hypothetical protein
LHREYSSKRLKCEFVTNCFDYFTIHAPALGCAGCSGGIIIDRHQHASRRNPLVQLDPLNHMPSLPPEVQDSFALLGPDWLRRVESADMPGLTDQPYDTDLADAISSISINQWPDVSAAGRALLKSGLWLLAGDLNRSHDISQAIDSPEGSFLHGIMHRREGDFGNAKYWFRQVGKHPVIDELVSRDDDVYRSPGHFVDACQQSLEQSDQAKLRSCQHQQWIEWVLLMRYCVSV